MQLIDDYWLGSSLTIKSSSSWSRDQTIQYTYQYRSLIQKKMDSTTWNKWLVSQILLGHFTEEYSFRSIIGVVPNRDKDSILNLLVVIQKRSTVIFTIVLFWITTIHPHYNIYPYPKEDTYYLWNSCSMSYFFPPRLRRLNHDIAFLFYKTWIMWCGIIIVYTVDKHLLYNVLSKKLASKKACGLEKSSI